MLSANNIYTTQVGIFKHLPLKPHVELYELQLCMHSEDAFGPDYDGIVQLFTLNYFSIYLQLTPPRPQTLNLPNKESTGHAFPCQIWNSFSHPKTQASILSAMEYNLLALLADRALL